jgi:hypothetical protein
MFYKLTKSIFIDFGMRIRRHILDFHRGGNFPSSFFLFLRLVLKVTSNV